MRIDSPIVINQTNLSLAWSAAFVHLMQHASCGPLVITFTGFSDQEASETPAIRNAVDANLTAFDKIAVADNAAMIFPWRTWVSHDRPDSKWLFERYKRIMPRLQHRTRCRHQKWHGTYFGRMVEFLGTKGEKVHPVNQLEHILDIWNRDRKANHSPRVSAMQVACFDPAKDQTGETLRGFPCLQQVGFAVEKDQLAVHAFYPMQYVFDRGYGNYLGLSHLGLFMAREMGLQLSRVTCYVSAAVLGNDVTKTALRDLKSIVSTALETASLEGPALKEQGAAV